MSHEFESGVFMRGLKAWHNLGTVLPEGDPAETDAWLAMQRAGCDWSASMQPAWMFNPLWAEGNGQPKGIQIPGVRAIMRDSDGKILGNAGDVPRGGADPRHMYQIYTNADMAKWAQPILDAKEGKVEAVASLFGGQGVYMLLRLGHNGDSHADIVPGDSVINHWLIANDYSGKHSLRVARCRTRVVCANTLAAAYGEGTYVKIRHSKQMIVTLDELQGMMRKENEAFSKDVDLFKTLARKSVTKKILREYVQSIFPDSFKEKKETKVEREKRERAESLAKYDALKAQNSAAGKSLVEDLLSTPSREEKAEPVLVSDVLESVERLVEVGQGSDIPGVRGTLYGSYNAVAEYLQYEAGRGAVGASDKRMDSMIFGGSASANYLALQKAQEFAKYGS